MLKAVILIGGPLKAGTGFRPLSLDLPKPLVPVAGHPIIYHQIKALSQIPDLTEIIIIGSYTYDVKWRQFITKMSYKFKINVRFLQEYTALGTAGGLYHFRDQILQGQPKYVFVLNSDVCGDFPLAEMLTSHQQKPEGSHTVLGTEATREQALNYGCMVEEKSSGKIVHYVEKPETFVSSTINCGIYLFSSCIFDYLTAAFQRNQEKNVVSSRQEVGETTNERISLERHVLPEVAGSRCLFVHHTDRFWSQLKTAGAVIYANRHLLALYRDDSSRLATSSEAGPEIIGDVYVHPTADVHPTAVLGPNVTILKHAVIGEGVRVHDSLVMEEACIKAHSCISYTLLGSGSLVGEWTRLEGLPTDPNPNRPFAKLDVKDLFDNSGKINPTICVIGNRVIVASETNVRNSIVMPDKQISGNVTNRIVI